MTNIEIQITSREGRGRRVTAAETSDALHELRQIGPCRNGITYYRGVFASKREAAASVRESDNALAYLIDTAPVVA